MGNMLQSAKAILGTANFQCFTTKDTKPAPNSKQPVSWALKKLFPAFNFPRHFFEPATNRLIFT